MIQEGKIQRLLLWACRWEVVGCEDILTCNCDNDKLDCLRLQSEQLYAQMLGLDDYE